jgi:hypothetical protein
MSLFFFLDNIIQFNIIRNHRNYYFTFYLIIEDNFIGKRKEESHNLLLHIEPADNSFVDIYILDVYGMFGFIHFGITL